MMHWHTVNDQVKEILLRLMQEPIFNDFRLVGGTALSLQLGHRKSVDIDLFTDAVYGSVDFSIIEQYMLDNFTYVSTSFGVNPAFGTSYLVGSDKQNAVTTSRQKCIKELCTDFLILRHCAQMGKLKARCELKAIAHNTI